MGVARRKEGNLRAKLQNVRLAKKLATGYERLRNLRTTYFSASMWHPTSVQNQWMKVSWTSVGTDEIKSILSDFVGVPGGTSRVSSATPSGEMRCRVGTFPHRMRYTSRVKHVYSSLWLYQAFPCQGITNQRSHHNHLSLRGQA